METKNQLTELLNSGALNVASPPRDAPSPLPTDDPFLHAPGAGGSFLFVVVFDIFMTSNEIPSQ